MNNSLQRAGCYAVYLNRIDKLYPESFLVFKQKKSKEGRVSFAARSIKSNNYYQYKAALFLNTCQEHDMFLTKTCFPVSSEAGIFTAKRRNARS
ncbi:MAG: hypothetical protein D3904_06495 [Candidatus Electrothrix sp. EH2]|nr:hypothetical protein [Candidatus Electrothrix sp. EH2]